MTPLSPTNPDWQFTGWWHQSGTIGLQNSDEFKVISVDTGATLWQLKGVEAVFTPYFQLLNYYWRGAQMPLDRDWVHFQLTDGRLARIGYDGSELSIYDIRNLMGGLIWGLVYGWSLDGEWAWVQVLPNPNINLSGVIQVQQDTGKIQVILDSETPRLWNWSPDGKWAYYFREGYGATLQRIRVDGLGDPEIVVQNESFYPLTWTPPYQAEWQPTHILAIGIGLMSFSTLTPIVLWRRRRKQRTA